MLRAVLAGVLGLATGSASAAEPPTDLSGVVINAPSIVEEADLTAKPSPQDVHKVIPSALRGQTIVADVKMRCFVDTAGKPKRCDLLSERPYGLGLGRIGTDLMQRRGQFKARKVDGKPVDGGQVEFTLVLSEPGRQPLLTMPIWSAVPGVEEMAAAWPAGRQGEEAVVVLRCAVGASGELKSCRGINEADKVMVGAAQTLSDRFRIRLTAEGAKRLAGADVIVSLRLFNPTSASGQERSVRAPEWISIPDKKAMEAVYPDRASNAGIISGQGMADCLVAPDGTLSDCRIVGEQPEAVGFGEATLLVAGRMKMNLWSLDGRPTAGHRIRLPVGFDEAEGEP